MRNMIFHTMNLSQPWIQDVLNHEIVSHHTISFIVLDEDPLYAQDKITLKDKDNFKRYLDSLKQYGINEDDIHIYHLEEMPLPEFRDVVEKSDVLVMIRNPELAMCFIDDMHRDILREFDGLVIGAGYGGLALLEGYSDEEGYHEGFGCIPDINLIYDFVQNKEHLSRAMKLLEMSGGDVVALPLESGIVIDESYFEVLGNGFILSAKDMDDLYEALETMEKW